MLRKIKSYVPQTTLQIMYKSFVLPISTTVPLYGMMVVSRHMLKKYKSGQRGSLPVQALINDLLKSSQCSNGQK